MQKIKMIGLDLDGTLLNDKKELTPYTRQVMEEAIRQGVTVLVATGRPWMGVPEFLKSFSGNGLCTDIEWSKDCPYAGWERSYGAASESG